MQTLIRVYYIEEVSLLIFLEENKFESFFIYFFTVFLTTLSVTRITWSQMVSRDLE
jgi:hypothetical protein